MARIVTLPSLVLLACALPAAAAPQPEGKRIALIIGNNAYSISPLQNAVNDARALDKALRGAGFQTILRENAGKTAMEEATAEFLQQLGPDDTALFFYAGHGIQIENENFLVPVDFEAASSVIQAKFRCFSMAQLFEGLKNRSKRSFVVLDACRSNPVAAANSLQAGLAQPQNAGRETYTAFSTGPGQVAADNPNGRNSWFSEALADIVGQRGLTVDDVFTRVKKRVSDATEGRQTPWTQSSLTGTFYFYPPENVTADNDPTVAEKWMEEARRREQRQEWAEAIDLVNRVLQKKPGGALETQAAAKLPYFTARKDAQARYEASDFSAAAALDDKALELDPFSAETAFEGVNSYLLGDRLPEALRLLQAIRVRGSSASIAKADAMLKELAPVLPEAAKELQAGIPQPPPIEQVFRGNSFGVPDFDAARRYLQSSPVSISRRAEDLSAAFPPPPAVVAVQAAMMAQEETTQVTNAIFHIEVVPTAATRDLVIRRVADAKPPSDFGYVQLDGAQGEAPVVFNGRVIAPQIPVKLQLPIGQYEVRTIQDGQVVSQQTVNVTVNASSAVTVKK
ncbi:MAG: caspase family protein [Acidobacteriia bacterium]|nr:caspase family protein [Terriglobia bacterium]